MSAKVFLLFSIAPLLLAQSSLNQQISGQVLDPTGGALAGAAVTILDVETGLTRATKTNESGNYVVPDLPVGTYRVTCEAPGFRKDVVNDNHLNTDVSIAVNFKLEVGSQADSVTIRADAI